METICPFCRSTINPGATACASCRAVLRDESHMGIGIACIFGGLVAGLFMIYKLGNGGSWWWALLAIIPLGLFGSANEHGFKPLGIAAAVGGMVCGIMAWSSYVAGDWWWVLLALLAVAGFGYAFTEGFKPVWVWHERI